MDVQRLLRKMRKKDAKAVPQKSDLRMGRPEPVDRSGLPCERCGSETRADDLECLYGNYWLCPKCARFHKSLARMQERG